MTGRDWTVEGRASLGYEVIDVAPTPAEHPCYTGWYAHQLDVDAFRQSTMLRPLLDRMARYGLLVKTGGVYRGDDGRTHCGACYYGLAADRHVSQERWAEIVAHPHWHRRAA